MTVRDLALIGAGYWGKNLARNFNQLKVLHTLCDVSQELLDSYSTDYTDVRKTQHYQSVLQDPDIKKVAIAAPAPFHYEITKSAILAGKDVFVEKPLCLDLHEGEELVKLANEKSRVLMVGHLLQYHPCILEIQRMLSSGELGKLQYITSNRLNLGKIRQEENSLWSFAPHDLSVILSLVGNELPLEVQCTGGSYLTPGIADTTLTVMSFAGNVRSHVYVSWLNPFKEQKLTVVGSQGMVVFDDTKPWEEKLVVHRDYLTWPEGRHPTPSKVSGEAIPIAPDEPLKRECTHFIECCSSRSTPRTDGREGLRVLTLLKAAQDSLQNGGRGVCPGMLTPPASPNYFAHPTAIIDSTASVGSGTKIWHFSHIMANARLGEHCNLGQNVVISPGVSLGNNVKVQNNVSIYSGTIIEDDVFLGPSCVLTNVSNPRSQIVRRELYEPTLIRRGATVGANATIVCGSTLGQYCFVAAGAVVTKDVPDYGLVRGNPARHVGWMSRHGHPLTFDGTDIATCPESGLRYRLETQAGAKRVTCVDMAEADQLPDNLAIGKADYRSFKNSNNKN